jgi:uncharacterized membrane protein
MRWLTLLQWSVVCAMFVAAAIVWPLAPDSVPTQFGITGEATRYTGKVEGLLSLPILALGLLVLLKVLPRIDPNRERYAEFATPIGLVVLAIEVFLALLYATLLAFILGVSVDPVMLIVALVGLLLIGVGTVLDRLRPNWFFGIRTPWTLSSDRAWAATHRAGRWVFIIMGTALVVAGSIQRTWLIVGAIGVCVVGAVGLVAYSFTVWRDDPDRRPRQFG